MTIDGFRRLALALPQTQESSHLDHPDFRVGKRIFAQQATVVASNPEVFRPVKGGWGARGATHVKLRAATRAALWPAMVAAWKNHASPALLKKHADLGG